MSVAQNQKSKSNINHKIVVISGKGGVGKSTIAINLAVALASQNLEVGLLDADIHGPSIPKLLQIENVTPRSENSMMQPILIPPHLKVISMAFFLPDKDAPIIWRGPLKMKAIQQFLQEVNWGKLDYLIVDLPPGTGDEPISIAQLISDCDGAVIVTTPQDVALLSVRKSINFARAIGMPIIGLIENMSGFICPHCGKETEIFKSGGGFKACLDFNVQFLGKIPIDSKIVAGGDEGKPFITECKNSPATKAFEKIVDKIEKFVAENKKKEVRK